MALAELIAKIKEKIVVVKNPNGSEGTGIVLDARGIIVTNSHVVDGAAVVGIETNDERSFLGRVVTANKKIDYAFIACRGLRFASYPVLSRREKLSEGEDVAAIGHPLGLEFTVSKGIVSSASREVQGVNYIQTDVPINPGNSGGPLLDSAGEIVGINTWIVSNAQGLSFAIPARYINEAFERLPSPDAFVSGSYCPACGTLNAKPGPFCSRCGVEIVPQAISPALAAGTGFCISCSTENAPEDRYCKKCGTTLMPKIKKQDGKKTAAAMAADTVITCRSCGRENRGEKYCTKCGSTLSTP
jgi:serine protease Do